jgi:hypothetical protein
MPDHGHFDSHGRSGFDARARLRSLLVEATAIQSGARTMDDVGRRLDERLEAEAEVCSQALRSVADGVGRSFADALELSTPLPPLVLPLVPSRQLVAQPVARPQARPARQPLSGRLLGVVMPAYGGTMMALVLPASSVFRRPGG